MAARSIASLTLSFGLVSIPVRLYSATESAASIRFNLLAKDGSRLKQQYVSEHDQAVVPRAEMVKGYEFEKDRFVLFTADELKKLEESTSHAIEIVAFIPEKSVDPLFYDKAYLLAPDKRGGKPYALLMAAMQKSGRCALAKWAWKAKQYVVQVRPTPDGLVLQQLLYAEEVRSLQDLNIEPVTVSGCRTATRAATDRADLRGRLRPEPLRGRGEETHPGCDRREDRRQGGGRFGACRRARRRRSGDRPDGRAAGEPGQDAGVGEHPGAEEAERHQRHGDAGREGTQAGQAGTQGRGAGRGSAGPRAREEVTRLSQGSPFSLRSVQQTLGLSRTVVRGLIDAGFVAPGRGARNEHRFSFQDLMLLRTAHALQQARVPPRKIIGALAKLRGGLPAELPLTGLRISAIGSEIVIRDRVGPRAVDSGQLLIDFEVAPSGSSVVFIDPAATAASAAARSDDAEAWFGRGEAAERAGPAVSGASGSAGFAGSAGSDASAESAEAAYRRALEIDPLHLGAILNLGAMWCEAGRCDEAAALYDAAVAQGAASPLLHFNHAIALEDQRQLPQALASYERAIALDPTLADAHFNAGRLHELLGDERLALRHFSAYKRLQRSDRS